jgi:hypothetical protein
LSAILPLPQITILEITLRAVLVSRPDHPD